MSGRDLRCSGFTLLELMFTLLMLAILAGLAGPAFDTLLARRSLNQVSSEMTRAIQLARSEAAKRGAPVRLEPLVEGDWTDGWRILADSNGDGSYNDDPVFTGTRISDAVLIEEGEENQIAENYITFSSVGSLVPLDDTPELIFRDTDCSYSTALTFRVRSSGQVVLEETPCTTH